MIITRRKLLAVGAALSLGSRLLEARAATRIRYLTTSPVPDVAAAVHTSLPKALGYWSDAGIDVDVTPFNGSSAATQVVLSGRADFAMASPEPLLVAKQSGGRIIAVYNHTRDSIYSIAAERDTPIKSLQDLKGKKIGVLSLSSGAVPFAKAMLRSNGLDPEKDVRWLPVGLGPQTANALQSKQVDALALWDYGYAILENLGFSFRHFTTPETSALLSFMLIGNEDFVSRNPEATAKMAQGIAKAVIFTQANPEAAVRLHWKAFPASKPLNVSEDEAIRHAVHVLNSRLDKYRIAGRKTARWGFFEQSDWSATQAFYHEIGLISSKPDVDVYYTNRLVAQINDFDADTVIAEAKAFK